VRFKYLFLLANSFGHARVVSDNEQISDWLALSPRLDINFMTFSKLLDVLFTYIFHCSQMIRWLVNVLIFVNAGQ